MKKLVLLALSAVVMFVSCSTPLNPGSTGSTVVPGNKVESDIIVSVKPNNDKEKQMESLKQYETKSKAIPESFDKPTWIGIYDNSPKINGQWMFMLVSRTDTLAWGDIHHSHEELLDNFTFKNFHEECIKNNEKLSKYYPYWCIVDDAFYNEHKLVLPCYLGDKDCYHSFTRFEFLNEKSTDTLKDEVMKFNEPTWISITGYEKEIGEGKSTTEEKPTTMCYRYFLVQGEKVYRAGELYEYTVSNVSNELLERTWNALLNMKEGDKEKTPYWSIIDEATYKSHKNLLPNYIRDTNKKRKIN